MNAYFDHFSNIGSKLFVIVYSSSVLPGMVPWIVIIISELRFRHAHQHQLVDHPLMMPWYPYSNYFAILALFVIVIFMFINPDTRLSVCIGAGYLIFLTITYFIWAKHHPDFK